MSVSPVSHSPSTHSRSTQPPGAGPPPGLADAFGEDWWLEVKPLAHAKVLKVHKDAVIKGTVQLPDRYTLEDSWTMSDRSTLALLGSETHKPQWAPGLHEKKFDLFVAHLNRKARPHLLFLTSSRRSSNTLYRQLAEEVLTTETGAAASSLYQPLEVEELKRIFDGLDDFQIINLGMHRKGRVEKKRPSESYRFVAGHHLDAALSGEKPFHTGHAVGFGDAAGRWRTLGFSRNSKVWGTDHLSIEELAHWCDEMADKLRNPAPAHLPSIVHNLTH